MTVSTAKLRTTKSLPVVRKANHHRTTSFQTGAPLTRDRIARCRAATAEGSRLVLVATNPSFLCMGTYVRGPRRRRQPSSTTWLAVPHPPCHPPLLPPCRPQPLLSRPSQIFLLNLPQSEKKGHLAPNPNQTNQATRACESGH